ncbi:phenylalanine--tRNA ligase subunit alpha [candidate division Kazan bacterium RBG_13_50_9]|uniref:Phenylalanine--tRNA ligase alpha subunit n=1 Tax=candidate division Kazan bacterium RBG_13_50_9 TaxID=1798535 RepID=A0A1F4NSV4_UNCK3|nr:MAG: phenylalanine--tRNA ligase subunit alpha [candidate division Kazan bacterium RBG_13_50_9]
MEDEIKSIVQEAKAAIAQSDAVSLSVTAAKFIGRKARLTQILRSIKEFSAPERQKAGSLANRARGEIEAALLQRKQELATSAQRSTMKRDTTLPGITPEIGHLSPVTIVTNQLIGALTELGFEIAHGPEAELEAYNFDYLNIMPNHPARDEWDTFWLRQGKDNKTSVLLRTHTSPVQIRYMLAHKPPLRIIAPGRTFRYEAEDATHASVFSQMEGLMVDKGISVAHLKAVIVHFVDRVLGEGNQVRFRPSFFPFTEPSFEVDVRFRDKWLELMGCGMVHPQVLRNVGIDPEEYSGFAFGVGIERLALLKYGINDVRLFLGGDMRFVKQF